MEKTYFFVGFCSWKEDMQNLLCRQHDEYQRPNNYKN